VEQVALVQEQVLVEEQAVPTVQMAQATEAALHDLLHSPSDQQAMQLLHQE
jgi:hypothetical protein